MKQDLLLVLLLLRGDCKRKSLIMSNLEARGVEPSAYIDQILPETVIP
jgi:hypothetical protein